MTSRPDVVVLSGITYADLADIEHEFEDAEAEVIRHQVKLTTPFYAKRERLISKIPQFWQLVLEQAPPDIDEYIQPTDSTILLQALTSLSVSHFEIADGGKGDPRSVAVRFEFTENEYFEDKVLEKKFWYRQTKDGWAGLVSEPVEIHWKKGKDTTDGLLSLACRVWDEEKKLVAAGKKVPTGDEERTALQKELAEKIENTGVGGLSFFAWFGHRGRRVTAEESREAVAAVLAKRKAREAERAKDVEMKDGDDSEDEDEEDFEDDWDEWEIFPDGEDLAIAIAEDLWPGAVKYFLQAAEGDVSDEEFEDSDDSDEEVPPLKKTKA